MNGKTEVSSGFDTLKLMVSIAILAAGIYGFYFWAEQPLFYRVGGMLVIVVLAAVVAAQSTIGRTAWEFIVTSRTEVRKVVWPTRTETVQTTLYVMVVVIVIGILLWLLDMFLLWAVKLLTGQGG
jgi:preprotein translocase subunit SecE